MREVGNEWEAQNRGIKVARLLEAARRLDLTMWDIALDVDDAIARVVAAAGVSQPSETTWEWLFTAMVRAEAKPVDTGKILARWAS